MTFGLKNARRRTQLLRAVAMLFLVQAGAELLFPELCQEEGTMSRSVIAAHVSKDKVALAFVVAVSSSPESRDNQIPDHENRDEDCFCCCTHVMPSPVFDPPENLVLKTQDGSPENVFIPTAPTRSPYHPPRSA